MAVAPCASATAETELLTGCPASTSAWETRCCVVAEQVIAAPTASVLCGQVSVPVSASVTLIRLIGTLPLLLTSAWYAMVSPVRAVFCPAAESVARSSRRSDTASAPTVTVDGALLSAVFASVLVDETTRITVTAVPACWATPLRSMLTVCPAGRSGICQCPVSVS